MVNRAFRAGLALLLFVAVPVRAQTGAPDSGALCAARDVDLRRAMVEVHEKQRNVGVASVVLRDGETAFSAYLGMADLEHEALMGPETRLGIASLTKLFTATALLRLVAAGLVDLDASVQRYVADFPVKEEGEITVRMLATHRSGIPHPQDRTPELFATHYETATEALEVFAHESLVAAPGSERVYSSSNYNLLAAVMEAVTGLAFHEVLEGEILGPLELEGTSLDDVLRPLPDRARRYSFYHPWTYEESPELFVVPAWDYSFNPGGGGLVSTAADVARFGAALTAPGLLPAEQLDLLYDPAWFGRGEEPGRSIYMTGSNPGVQAGLAVHRDPDVVVVVLSNTWGIGARSAEMVNLARGLERMCAVGPAGAGS